ncbi:Acyl-protein synthetase, LuxE [Fodinibius roseus]|uniref:Acyl-protein synthetase, LuxE n=1 Tax=Fodinibius roseus TaxID=1194090 RepID=A0A1M5DGW8_9BACT|nr:hypothetical protein [Fodinibius roseus]SHF66289.1 Acyl-protein synthetase, LuxE [Fodinibius roseus]
MRRNWPDIIFSDELSFEEKARGVFEYQVEQNPVYRRYCGALNPEIPEHAEEYVDTPPLLPIKAFKDAGVTTRSPAEADLVFKSSGTSGMKRSVHYVADSGIYEQSLLKGFRRFYQLDRSVIWGYTPGYAENPHSSLIYMIRTLINRDSSGLSRFLPLEEPLEEDAIREVVERGKQLILFGAAFGLLDLLELEETSLPSNSIVIETGGMKTHRREISRDRLHRRLANGFGLDASRVHSEYGMAELLSQAYATGGKWFKTVPWLRVTVRNPDNPAEVLPPYKEGRIGLIDLANVYSCSFLLTGDRGVMDRKGRFRVGGRWDPKDLRGCNFLIDED